MPALLLITVRFFVPRRCNAAIRCSGMPHRPKPPIMMDAPSWITATASSAVANTLFMDKSYLLRRGCRSTFGPLLHSRDLHDLDWRRQALGFGIRRHVGRRGGGLNLPYDLHARHDSTEGGKALAVGITRTAEIKRRLIVDGDEPSRGRAVGRAAGHRHHAILVQNTRHARAFEWNCRKALFGLVHGHTGLDHFDLDRAFWLIVQLYRAMKRPAVVMPGVHVLEKIRGGVRRALRIELDHDVAQLGLHAHARIRLRKER